MGMSKERMAGVAGVIGFALGVGVTLGLVDRAAPTPTAPDRQSGPAGPAPAAAQGAARAALPATPPERPDDADDVESLRTELEWLRSIVDPLRGPPPQWPASDAFGAASVEASIEAGFPDSAISLDCREFPCIAVVETGEEVPSALADDIAAHQFPRDAYGRVGEHLSAEGIENMTLSVRSNAVDDGGYRILVAWFDKDREAELGDRLQARFELLAEHGYAGP